ncbi:MAG: hypothetical protein KKG69_17985 [Alphaproteobacteria bacterium]|uniref:Uncharacterized protein n=2 Tax=viral metagenome TaxID=1070528 RepID=A0A6M3JEQ7_9ZZZZ|nr:hypothetical protein [Alphaproteobacteria bacterium]
MSSARPSPRMLGLEALTTCDMLLGLIADVDRLAKEGRQADAGASLAVVVTSAAAIRPMIHEVIRAQRQAAEALHLTQRPDIRVIASIGCPQPHPNPANDERHPNTTNQPEPAA